MSFRSEAREGATVASGFLGFFVPVIVVLVLLSLGLYAFYAPARIAIDNAAFHNSQPYNDGMARELSQYRIQFAGNLSDEQKNVIQGTIRHDFAGYDSSRLDPADRAFLQQMLGGQ
jgi:hypothetical protein